ncbi:hypothetical protein QTL97_15060 [Sporosarcina thermotolerans]|uniref:Lipoprotein n=1 Tax=Sporosarcina thermotolerans TaxID=633404 RepID=A0AAW9AF15_9BACL|nr:hypothetical protein [Sporosarcina thermotolerans]MDW0118251.1 hypothetical protein [Sporosarcina thermotolerans]
MKKLLPFVLLILLLSACNESVSITNEEIPDSSSLTETNFEPMPNSIPDDFGFSLQFGITKKNEINTFNGTFTKDLITAGTVTTDLTLTEEEMVSIYEMMKDVKFAGTKHLIPTVIDCAIEPYGEDEWEVLVNGEIIRHSVSEAYCKPTDDAKQLIELRDYIFDLIQSKNSYKELPDAEGGYE